MYSRGKLDTFSVSELRKIALSCGYHSQKMKKQDWIEYIMRNQQSGSIMEYFELEPATDEYGHMLLISLPSDDLAKEYGSEGRLPVEAEAGFFSKSLPSDRVRDSDQDRYRETEKKTNLYIYATSKRDCYLAKEYLDSCFVPYDEQIDN